MKLATKVYEEAAKAQQASDNNNDTEKKDNDVKDAEYEEK